MFFAGWTWGSDRQDNSSSQSMPNGSERSRGDERQRTSYAEVTRKQDNHTRTEGGKREQTDGRNGDGGSRAKPTNKDAEIDRLRDELARAQKEVQKKDDEIRELKTRLEQSQDLSSTRAHELRDVQTWLSVAAEPSEQEIIRVISHLNEEIYQCSAKLVENWSFSPDDTDTRQDACERVTSIFGQGMTNTLRYTNGDVSERETVTQIAIQNCLTRWACWYISSWTFDNKTTNQLIANVYHGIQGAELPIIAGRWRSLTQQHVVTSPEVEVALNSELLGYLCDILLASGIQLEGECIYDMVSSRFEGSVHDVVKRTVDARKTIGIDAVSSDFIPFTIGSGGTFDDTKMTAAYKGGARDGKEKVVCTIEMGILKRGIYTESDGGDPVNRGYREMTLKTAKVVLESQVRELVNGFAR